MKPPAWKVVACKNVSTRSSTWTRQLHQVIYQGIAAATMRVQEAARRIEPGGGQRLAGLGSGVCGRHRCGALDDFLGERLVGQRAR
jgi:hypothetical protein